MIQRIRKHILAFKKNLNRSLAKNNSSARLEPDSKGQVAIILIIMTAIALIFYAVTLNLGRMSGAKTMTTMAAEKTASVLASQMASYAQKLVKENLKGSLEVCDKTSLFTAIISMIIIIIVAVIAIILAPVTSGGSAGLGGYIIAMAIVAIILSIVSVVMQATVVQPGITSMWNKIIGETMSLKNQFVESGVRTALQTAITDSGEVADVFDEDTDRIWGFTGNVPNDMVSRFGFYYTQRLKRIQTPDDTEIMAFMRALDDFMHGDCLYDGVYGSDCHGDHDGDGSPDAVDEAWGLSDPLFINAACSNGVHPACIAFPTLSEANMCCLPSGALDPLSWTSVGLRPDCCDIGAGQCNESGSCTVAANMVSPYSNFNVVNGNQYSWVFDPNIENNYNNDPEVPIPRECVAAFPGFPNSCCGNGFCEKLYEGLVNEVWEDHPKNDENSGGANIDDDTTNAFYCPQDCYQSLREQIGRDDEHRLYRKNPLDRSQIVQVGDTNGFIAEDTTGFYDRYAPDGDEGKKGVYPLFWRIADWGWDLSIGAVSNVCYWDANPACVPAGPLDHPELEASRLSVIGLPRAPATLTYDTTWIVPSQAQNSLIATDPPIAVDRIRIPPDIIAANGDCAQNAFDDLAMFPALGFWKKGSDRFCSAGDVAGDAQWPYFGNCPKSGIMRSCACWELDDLGNWVVCTTDEDGDGVNATYDCPTCSLPCQQLDENGLHLVVPAGDPDNPADWTCDNDFGDGDGSNQTVPADCACGDVGALAPANWPEDVLEDVYYGLTEFLRFGTTQLMKDRTDLVNNFDSWYGELAMWIEPLNPPADRTTVPACYNCSGTATEAAEGILWQWRDALAEIRDRLNLLSVSHVAQAGNLCGNAWCVPMPACATFVGAHEEHDKEENTFDSNSNGVIGDIEDVAACLNYNINDQRILLAVDLADVDGDLDFNEYLPVSVITGGADPGIATGNAQKFKGCFDYCNEANCEYLPRSLVPGVDAIVFDASDDALVLALENCRDSLGASTITPPIPDDQNMSVADCQTVCGSLFPGGTDPYGLNAAPYNLPVWVNPVVNWIPQCNAECSNWCSGGVDTNFRAAVRAAAEAVPPYPGTMDAVDHQMFVNCLNSLPFANEAVGLGPNGAVVCESFCEHDPRTWPGDPAFVLDHNILINFFGMAAPMSPWVASIPSVPAPEIANSGSCSFWWDGVTDAGLFRQRVLDAIITAGGSCAEIGAGNFLSLVNQSYEEAENQVSKFTTRMNFLNNRIPEIKRAHDLFTTAEQKFTDFLNGPAQDIIQYRINFEDGSDNGLPSSAIYYWQSPPFNETMPVGTGAWHIVRVDVRTPGRCAGRCNPTQSGPQEWPSIKTETHDWGTKRCYFIINYVGTVKARVTRVDEDQTNVGRMFFPNGVPIWDFRFNHPLRPQTGAAFDFAPLGRVCTGGGAAVCPNGSCEVGESSATCWQDCPLCPDGACVGGETAVSCPQDCPVATGFCGDGTCSNILGEHQTSCPKDCGSVTSCCGDLMVENPVDSLSNPLAPQPYIDLFPDMGGGTRKIYSGALMMDKSVSDGSADDNSECWLTVNRLLTRGVSSEACARYYWEGNGFSHRFVDCIDW